MRKRPAGVHGARASDAETCSQTLLLTTTGRKSGEARSTPVLYLQDGDRLVVVASNFGREHHPAWSANLLADPRATVRIRDRERSVVARRQPRRKSMELWPRLLELYPTWTPTP